MRSCMHHARQNQDETLDGAEGFNDLFSGDNAPVHVQTCWDSG